MLKNKTYRRLSVLAVFAFTLACLSGCSASARNQRKAEKALLEKYGEEFEITDYRRGGLFQGYDTMMAHPVDEPDLTFYLDLSDSGRVSDAYVTAKVCQRISRQIEENISGLEETYFVHTFARLPVSYLEDPDVTLSEYLEEGPNRFGIQLFLRHTDAEAVDIVMALLPMMEGLEEVDGWVSIYFVDDAMMEDVKEYIATHDQLYDEFREMTEDAYIGTIDFEQGGFSLTEPRLREMAGDRL